MVIREFRKRRSKDDDWQAKNDEENVRRRIREGYGTARDLRGDWRRMERRGWTVDVELGIRGGVTARTGKDVDVELPAYTRQDMPIPPPTYITQDITIPPPICSRDTNEGYLNGDNLLTEGTIFTMQILLVIISQVYDL